MDFTKGLYPYEAGLFWMGVVLFVVLIMGLFRQINNKQSVGAFLGLFLLPILMVGYPSIRSLQYKEGMLTMNKSVHDLGANPANTAARDSLAEALQRTTPRISKDPSDVTTFARAHTLLGNPQAAAPLVQNALQANQSNGEGTRKLGSLFVQLELIILTPKVERNPADQASRDELQKYVSQAEQMQWSEQRDIDNLHRAQAALAKTTRAQLFDPRKLVSAPSWQTGAGKPLVLTKPTSP